MLRRRESRSARRGPVLGVPECSAAEVTATLCARSTVGTGLWIYRSSWVQSRYNFRVSIEPQVIRKRGTISPFAKGSGNDSVIDLGAKAENMKAKLQGQRTGGS